MSFLFIWACSGICWHQQRDWIFRKITFLQPSRSPICICKLHFCLPEGKQSLLLSAALGIFPDNGTKINNIPHLWSTQVTLWKSVHLFLNSSPSFHEMITFCTAAEGKHHCFHPHDWGERQNNAPTSIQLHWFPIHITINFKVLFISTIFAWITRRPHTNFITCYIAFRDLTSILTITDLCLCLADINWLSHLVFSF